MSHSSSTSQRSEGGGMSSNSSLNLGLLEFKIGSNVFGGAGRGVAVRIRTLPATLNRKP